ncbi:MAG: HAD family phosphatase [Candidatus Solibacter usitatus]|nr:HAD family phosphatase [Candidatus Solibacter usitatus]
MHANGFDAVLFDFDGVIVDSEPLHQQCWREVLAPLGIDLTWEHYHKHFVGLSDRRMFEDFVAMASKPVRMEDLIALYPAKNALFGERILALSPFAAGIRELIAELSAYRLGVVSSSNGREVRPVLAVGGILARLDVTICGEDVTRHKPDPEPYRRAAEILGVRNPLVVEDSEAGESSGRAAGFEVLRISSPDQTTAMVRRRLGMT